MPAHPRRPEWLRLSPCDAATVAAMRKLTRPLKLHTVCDSARCPNRQECFSQGTAAFMILGDICTRDCSFCAVESGHPQSPEPGEPDNVVAAITKLRLRYVVITSVTRDDLPDGGASHFAHTISAIHDYDPGIMVEALIPDFGGSLSALKTVTDASLAVLNHNVETVPRLYPEVRPQADYQRSLEVLRNARLLNPALRTKSGLMVGLGETRDEIMQIMVDLRNAGCDLLTIGQYLAPSTRHHELVRFVHPDEFADYQNQGERMGFHYVAAGPLVRSSFHAGEAYIRATRSQP